MLILNYSAGNCKVGRHTGGITDPTYFFKGTTFQNFYYGDSAVSGQTEKSSWLVSAGPHYTSVFAPKPGGMSSRNNTSISLSYTANAVMGLPGSGSVTVSFSPSATGGLIVSGSGSATISFSPTATILSIAAASGSTTVTFTPTASIGALAGLVGTATVTLTPAAISYAIGYLSGTSTNETEFSADALAQAVWEVAASDFNTAGTMGEKLNDAGSAGNPWASLLASNNSAGSFGEFVQSLPSAADVSTQLMDSTDLETGITVKEALRIVLAALSGKISGAGTNTITIRDVNDTTDRIVATVDGDGNRTAVTVDGS